MHTYTLFQVISGSAPIDSASTQQWDSESAALDAARAMRDRFNASEYVTQGGTPARIVRCRRTCKARPL